MYGLFISRPTLYTPERKRLSIFITCGSIASIYRPLARGVQRVQLHPLDTRSPRSAMNFVISMFVLLTIDTYSDNCQLCSAVLSIAHFRPTCT